MKDNVLHINNKIDQPLWQQIGFYAFYLALIIEIVIVIVDKSCFINPIEGKLFQLTFLLCAIKILLTKYNLKEWLIMLAFLLVGIIVEQVTDRNEVIRFVTFVAAAKDINQKKALKMVLWLTTVGVLLLAFLSFTGVCGEVYLEADYYRGTGVEKRYCFGLGHPNAFHCMIWALITLAIYVYYDCLKWWHYILILMANVTIFAFTDSRTGFLATCISVILGLLSVTFVRLKDYRMVYYIAFGIVIASLLFSVIVACFNGLVDGVYIPLPTILDKLNQKMTGRIFDGGHVGNIHKWRLFSDANEKGYLDMGFIKLFHWYGIVPAILYILSSLQLIVYSKKNKRIDMIIIIISITVYTISEAHVISPYFARNYLLMLFFGVWSEVFFVQKGSAGYFWQLKTLIGKKNV